MAVLKKPPRGGHPDLALLHQELSQLIGRLVESIATDHCRPRRVAAERGRPFECRGVLTIIIEGPRAEPDSLRVACANGQRW
jgi:hypothetical protein